MSIPPSFIQELLARVDVVDVVGRYVPLKKAGANFMGLCPFHGEKSPSFSVSPTRQFFHCFGCGKSGDAIAFLMEHAGLGFHEAVHDLARQAGMQVPDAGAGSAQERERASARRQQQATLVQVLEQAASAWSAHLRTAPQAIAYLKGRGLSGHIAKRYGLGYAPAGQRWLAGVFADYASRLLHESGLVIESESDGRRYDRFRDRIMFPIRNVKGECIGFGGRVLGDAKPKYLNSPETAVFHKGRELYGLYEARAAIRQQGYALVTEGYMDVVALAQAGFSHTVATLGTACTAEHMHKLFRFTDAVVFSFDGDAAGRRGARKALDAALPHASDTRSVKFLFLPAEHDPDSFIRSQGSEAFAQHVQQALPLSRFLVQAACEGCDLGSAEGRAHMLANAHPLWSLMPDGALKRQLLGELAALGQLPPFDLAALWAQPPAVTLAMAPASAALAIGTVAVQSVPPHLPADASFAPPPSWPDAFRHSRPAGAPVWHRGSRRWQRDVRPAQPPLPRNTPTRRSDHAARLLLLHMALMEQLSHEDLAMLCALPAPHGPLFAWLEAQWHEYGAQPWSVLRGQAEPALAAWVEQVLGDALAHPDGANGSEGNPREWQAELRDLLGRMQIECIKQQESALIAATAHDPDAMCRYRALQARRRALEEAFAPKGL